MTDVVLVCKRAAEDPKHRARKATRPGPYCATCRRDVKKERKLAAHGRHVERVYGITEDQYDDLYRLQGGRCFVCEIAVGRARSLAVEHDHHKAAYVCRHDPLQGCPQCITGLVCSNCNRNVLGMLGRGPATYDRIAEALRNPPAARYFERTTP